MRATPPDLRSDPDSKGAARLRWLALGLRVLGWSGALALGFHVGFAHEPMEGALLASAVEIGLGAFAFDLLLRLWLAADRAAFVRPRLLEFATYGLTGFALVAVATAGDGAFSTAAATLSDIALGIGAAARVARRLADLGALGMRVPTLVLGSFGGLVLLGALALMLPASRGGARTIGFVDATFQATSAVCVTGLATIDVGKDLSQFGQAVLLGLVQIGGVGIITFALLLTSFGRGGLNLRQLVAAREIVSGRWLGETRAILYSVIAVTLTIELIGAALLYSLTPVPPGPWSPGWFSLFHAVNAFCNAGFGLEMSSLGAFDTQPLHLAVLGGLIVAGGLGFTTLVDCGRYVRSSVMRLAHRVTQSRGLPPPLPRLTLQARLAIALTIALVVLGAVAIFLIERRGALRGYSVSNQAAISLFHSITPRTAGFAVVPIEAFHDSSCWIMIALMAIGGCPGSTAGGIKTVTFALLLASVLAILRGRESVEIGRRRLPFTTVTAAVAVATVYAGCVFVTTLALLLTDPEVPVRHVLFEAVSALSTVGLSYGITPNLSIGGKLVLCAAMFLGRVGPITLAAVLSGKPKAASFEYPEEAVSIG